jgi:hypothetical protein
MPARKVDHLSRDVHPGVVKHFATLGRSGRRGAVHSWLRRFAFGPDLLLLLPSASPKNALRSCHDFRFSPRGDWGQDLEPSAESSSYRGTQ